MVQTEFERIMLTTALDTNKKIGETCERLAKVEQKIEDMAEVRQEEKDAKNSLEDKKYKRVNTFISIVAAVSGFSFIWNIVHPVK